jgi:hypothetical protein
VSGFVHWHTPDPFGTAAIPAAIGGTREVLALTKGCDAQDVVGNHAGVVVPDRTGRGATDQNVWIGPHRQAGAAAAVCLVAHDVAPLVAMDIATLVTGTDQMPNFMHEGKVGFGAGMVHDGKGFKNNLERSDARQQPCGARRMACLSWTILVCV